MSSVRTVALTGNASIDGLLSGVAWVGGVTHGVPSNPAEYGCTGGSNEPLGLVALVGAPGLPATQAWIGSRVFNEFADLIALGITPTAAAGADIRLAMTTTPDAASFGAYAHYRGDCSEGGDVWFNTTDFNVVVLGGFGHFAFMPEIGHGFGLKHGHEHDPPWIIQAIQNVLRFDRGSVAFSVMTYRSYIGGPTDFYRIADGHGPQRLMMLDTRTRRAAAMP